MNPPSRSLQWAVWGGLAVTVAAVLAAFLLQRRPPTSTAASELGAQSTSSNRLPVLFQIPAFALTNQDQQRVTLSMLSGKIWLADIIFTRCAGPCPEMVRRTAQLQALLKPEWPVRFVTLTTDPNYDTPAVLRAHGQRFGAVSGRWHFLTGPKKAIIELAVGGLKLTALDKDPAKQEDPNDLFIHSTQFVLVDGAGRARALFENEDPEMNGKVLQAVQQLMLEQRLSVLPPLNAALNGLSACFLLAGFILIRRGRISAHRTCMLLALTASTLFLASYLYYHFHAGRTTFRDPNWFRPIYLTLLLTHTLLAVAILPLIFVTVLRAARGLFERHKKIARWTWPLWMYVSVTGVLIYFLLYHIFPQTPL